MPTAFATEITSSRKEPLSELVARVHAAFVAAGETPVVRFTFADGHFGGVSSVDRVLKRYPELARFAVALSVPPGTEGLIATAKSVNARRSLTNRPGTPAAGEEVPFETILAIAAGVPRSFPFHNVLIAFGSPAFGKDIHARLGMASSPGIFVGDSWWVNGRERSLTALATVDDDAGSTTLVRGSELAADIIARCGKAKKTTRVAALYADMDSAAMEEAASGNARLMQAVKAVQVDYKNRLEDVVAMADLPHDLPPASQARSTTPLGVTTGPKKPVLVRAFAPLGYRVAFESGTFTLARERPHGVTVEVSIDVGTWSKKLTAMFIIRGPSFRTVLSLPVTRDAKDFGSYPLGDADRWQQLVENLAALVAELDRTFVPDVEAAVSRETGSVHP